MLGVVVSAPNPYIDTSSQRPATGLDTGARKLMLTIVGEALDGVRDPLPAIVIRCFFENRYGDFSDYMASVAAVWGDTVRHRLNVAVDDAQIQAGMSIGLARQSAMRGMEAGQLALLLYMPEPDFRLAVELTLRRGNYLAVAADRITTICRNRGIPWQLHPTDGFQWTGDETVEHYALAPALTALNDPRLAPGAGTEFAQARAELKLGTPEANKQVLHEAACAVESAMKVVLLQLSIGYDSNDTAQKLYEKLRDGGAIAADTEKLVLACATPRNKRAGHGGGATAHSVETHEAEAFLASAATTIVFLAKLLP
jgi:hypothetical protein